ncbi:MAG: zf-HC2 domain-containing protein, partial [Chloroflexota bacterium]|nr:zf-HC2 domain-containing protein [Chloroflexota bacterium]
MTHYPPYPSTHPDAATLGAYHDGELSGALTTVETHLASCPRCRQELRELDRLDAALGALPALEPSPDAYDRVLARAAQPYPRPERSVRFAPRRPLWAVTIALAALAALVGGYDFLVTPRAGLIGNGSY